MNYEPCIRGCITTPMNEDEPDMPRLAEYGLLCASCYRRIEYAIRLAPDLVANIRAQLTPTSTANDGMPRGKSDPPAPLNVTALDDADCLFAKFVLWTEVVGGAMRVPQPSVAVWANFQEVQGFRGPLTVREAHDLMSELTDWFLIRLESIAYLPMVGELHDDVVMGWEDALGVVPLRDRYPIEPRKVRPAEKRICPTCGKQEVSVVLTAGQDADVKVACGHCGWTLDPKGFKEYAELFAA